MAQGIKYLLKKYKKKVFRRKVVKLFDTIGILGFSFCLAGLIVYHSVFIYGKNINPGIPK